MPASPGETHHNAKMTVQTVKEARRAYATGDFTITALADKYRISHQSMSAILHGKTWKNVQ